MVHGQLNAAEVSSLQFMSWHLPVALKKLQTAQVSKFIMDTLNWVLSYMQCEITSAIKVYFAWSNISRNILEISLWSQAIPITILLCRYDNRALKESQQHAVVSRLIYGYKGHFQKSAKIWLKLYLDILQR